MSNDEPTPEQAHRVVYFGVERPVDGATVYVKLPPEDNPGSADGAL